ncbi:Ig-like domain-containing protein [Agreia bicolorata]|uniref:Ig-like domain-containing protein n=2 Tax=Agreia bicolorata TaxID=110935 RepID=A0A1T4YN76_9MICO|nr:Ig-like domain-containing protein [Agreia bicolorata]
MTATELATASGCSRTTIYGAETGSEVPSEQLICRIDEVLRAEGLIVSRYEGVLSEKRAAKMSRSVPSIDAAPDASDDDESWFLEETIPDGTLMPRGHHFVKTWTIINTGKFGWHGRYLQRVGSPAGVGLITTPQRVPVPTTLPGESAVLAVPCVSQYVEGTSRAHFKMADAHGRLFFKDRYDVGLVVQVTVVLGMELMDEGRRPPTVSPG